MKTGAAKTRAIRPWGNSLGVRIPREIQSKADLAEGDQVSFEVKGPGLVLMRAHKERITLDQLVSRLNAKNQDTEFDWGAPAGDEIW